MSTETTTDPKTAPEAPATGEGEGESGSGPSESDGGTQSSEPTTNDGDGGEPLGKPGLAALRKERKAREAAEAKVKELEREGMSEADKMKAELADERQARKAAEERARDAATLGEFTKQAISAGVDPSLADLAYRESADSIDVDENGKPVGITEALDSLKESRPALFAKQAATPGVQTPNVNTNTPSGSSTSGDGDPQHGLTDMQLALAKAEGLTPEQYAEAMNHQPDKSKLFPATKE